MAKPPLLPGFNFENHQNKDFHLNQHFNLVNGYSIPKLNLSEFPDVDLEPSFKSKHQFQPYNVKNDLITFDPLETYSKFKKPRTKPFTPQYVIHDRKCLSFQGYFKQAAPAFSGENIVYRRINLIYYLEDDTMTIIEPPVDNSGYPQGRLVRRGRIPKSNSSGMWHWKHLNVGIDIEVYGIVYHLSRCDEFTLEYLLSQGIEVNENEEIPSNVLVDEKSHRFTHCYGNQAATPPHDKLYKFLQCDRKVLRFYALWKDNGNHYQDTKHYKIYYYLIDDTIEIRRPRTRAAQNEPFKRLLSRIKLVKNAERRPDASCVPGTGPTSSHEYYEPKDLLVGGYFYVLGRKFLIYDCDEFTRRYYKEYLKLEQPAAVSIPEKHVLPTIKKIPPHTGIGQPDDTLQSCLSIIPKPPRKDVIHYIENVNKFLRYSAKLDSTIENDSDRQFILQFSLADGKISIYEVEIPNSGFTRGYFLKSTLVPKSTSQEGPQADYYTPADFIIGTNVNIFGRQFTITGADLAVHHYMEKQPHKFSEQAKKSIEDYLKRKGLIAKEPNDSPASTCQQVQRDNAMVTFEKSSLSIPAIRQ